MLIAGSSAMLAQVACLVLNIGANGVAGQATVPPPYLMKETEMEYDVRMYEYCSNVLFCVHNVFFISLLLFKYS